jgi:hypothetical protein
VKEVEKGFDVRLEAPQSFLVTLASAFLTSCRHAAFENLKKHASNNVTTAKALAAGVKTSILTKSKALTAGINTTIRDLHRTEFLLFRLNHQHRELVQPGDNALPLPEL